MDKLTFESAIKHAVFYNYPQERSKKDYNKIINEIIEYLMRFHEIKAVYQFGTNASPGISDIDLIIILNDDSAPNRLAKINFYPFQKDTNSLFIHPPLLFNEMNFTNINILYPHLKTHLRRINGKPVRIELFSKQQQKLSETALFTDLSILLYSKDFIREILSQRIDVRYILCRLSSFGHTLRMFRKITKERKSEWEDFADASHNLKKNWFNDPQESLLHLKEYLLQTIKFNEQIIFDFALYLQKEFNTSMKDNWSYKNPYFYTLFLSDYNPKNSDKYQNLFFKIFQKTGLAVSIMPNNLGVQPQIYSRINGTFGNHIKRYLSAEQNLFDIDAPFAEMIERRGNYLQDYLSFLQSKRLSFGYPLNFYGFRLNSNGFNSLYDRYISLKSKYLYYKIQSQVTHA